jgi:hypothetical protein
MSTRFTKLWLVKDYGETPINQKEQILGLDLDNINIRLTIESKGKDPPPPSFDVSILTRAPGRSHRVQSSMASPLIVSLVQDAGTLNYRAKVPLAKLAGVQNMPDDVPEVATVVRTGGTSDRLFRSVLEAKGWAHRGTAVQPAIGKPDHTGDPLKEQPDARMLFFAGGVEVVDVSLVRPPGKEFAAASLPKTWMFVRSPADIFFYSGHGAWWDGNLLRDQGNHHYDSWLEPNELLGYWMREASNIKASPMDIDVLIINGCSVLFWNRLNETVDDTDRKSWGLSWAELLTSKQGPLLAILGYRATAPLDDPMGNLIAQEFARQIVGGLGKNYDKYPRTWLEVNAKHEATRTAAAIDNAGYWYINHPPKTKPGQPRNPEAYGHDSTQPDNAILGPFKIP